MSGRRARALAFIGGVAGAGLALLSLTQPWLEARVTDVGSVLVGADVAAPAVSALAVASLALVGALAIANTVVRWILSGIQLLLGAGIIVATIGVLADTAGASLAAVSAVTGVSGDASVRAVIASVDVALWPWVAVAAGAVLILTAVWTAFTARSWPGAGAKYSSGSAAPSTSTVSEWDALSQGSDPTD